MKRLAAILAVVALLVTGTAPAALGANQPSRGEHSTGRNDAGFGGGPHCHILIVDSAQEQFTVQVFPSHTGHDASGLSGAVFAADANCDGVP